MVLKSHPVASAAVQLNRFPGISRQTFCGIMSSRIPHATATHADKLKCPVCSNEMAKNSLEKQPPNLHVRAFLFVCLSQVLQTPGVPVVALLPPRRACPVG